MYVAFGLIASSVFLCGQYGLCFECTYVRVILGHSEEQPIWSRHAAPQDAKCRLRRAVLCYAVWCVSVYMSICVCAYDGSRPRIYAVRSWLAGTIFISSNRDGTRKSPFAVANKPQRANCYDKSYLRQGIVKNLHQPTANPYAWCVSLFAHSIFRADYGECWFCKVRPNLLIAILLLRPETLATAKRFCR